MEPTSTANSQSCQLPTTDCILRVSSQRHFIDSPEPTANSSLTPVRSLVGAFEDIGLTKRRLTRPLTIHVDSFSSDPFAHTAISTPSTLPLKRSQSLQVMSPPINTKPCKKADKRFNIRTVTTSAASAAQRFLKPYWKMKMDNSKQLVHSVSSAAVTSTVRSDDGT